MSADADGDPEKIVQRAIELGIPVVGLSDHYDFNPIDRSFGCYDYYSARNDVDALRQKYGDRIEILLGVEITYETPYLDEITAGLAGRNFDYVIGSIHYVDEVMISERACVPLLELRRAEDIYGAYFRELLSMLGSGLVQVVGHFDLCKRYGVQAYGPFTEDQVPVNLIEVCLRKMAAEDIALEINTSGYRQKPREPYPGESVIRRYLDLGGRLITTGSDAHSLEIVGAGLEDTRDLLLKLGVREVCYFRNKRPVFIPV